jgi:lambda repressor-like predicted transcriptional regulator
MDKHYGQIVEYRVRKNGYCISDLARATNVNRRSIYNWFNQKHLKNEVIYKIGCIIRHDFSQEFPEIFKSEDFKIIHQVPDSQVSYIAKYSSKENEIWKNKYLQLLETFNEMITK